MLYPDEKTFLDSSTNLVDLVGKHDCLVEVPRHDVAIGRVPRHAVVTREKQRSVVHHGDVFNLKVVSVVKCVQILQSNSRPLTPFVAALKFLSKISRKFLGLTLVGYQPR